MVQPLDPILGAMPPDDISFPSSTPMGGAPPAPPSPFAPMDMWSANQGIPLPPENPYVDAPDDQIPIEFQTEAFDYVSGWCRESRKYVKAHIDDWQKEWDIFYGRLGIRELGNINPDSTEDNSLEGKVHEREDEHLSDFVYPLYPAVRASVTQAYSSIFSGPDPVTVTREDATSPPSSTSPISVTDKIGKLLYKKLREGGVHHKISASLFSLNVLGAAYAKVYWNRRTFTRRRWNLLTFEIEETQETIIDCPVIAPIPLDRMLVDWKAEDCDIQNWRGIGHRALRSYEEIAADFAAGRYTLNKNEFLKKWRNMGESSPRLDDQIHRDDLQDDSTDDISRFLDVWEWHGRVPSNHFGDIVECCVTFVTELDSDTPEDGLLIRLTTRPILHSGKRPFVGAVYLPDASGPFSGGMREGIKDVHYQLSQFIGQIQDTARYSNGPQLRVRDGSPAHMQLEEDARQYPGRIWRYDNDPDDISPMPPMQAPVDALAGVAAKLEALYERSTYTATAEGVNSGSRITATHAQILQQQSLIPSDTITDLFVRSYFEPALNLALDLLQQHLLEDQTIVVSGDFGMDVPIQVTAQEIQEGRYHAASTLTKQDSTKIAKAQSIERIIPLLQQIEPRIMQENQKVSWIELLKRYIDLLDLGDRVIAPLSPQDMMMLQQQQMAQQMQQQGGPQGQQPPGPNGGPPQLVTDGGPMGDFPSDLNVIAQLLQMNQTPPTSTGPGNMQ